MVAIKNILSLKEADFDYHCSHFNRFVKYEMVSSFLDNLHCHICEALRQFYGSIGSDPVFSSENEGKRDTGFELVNYHLDVSIGIGWPLDKSIKALLTHHLLIRDQLNVLFPDLLLVLGQFQLVIQQSFQRDASKATQVYNFGGSDMHIEAKATEASEVASSLVCFFSDLLLSPLGSSSRGQKDNLLDLTILPVFFVIVGCYKSSEAVTHQNEACQPSLLSPLLNGLNVVADDFFAFHVIIPVPTRGQTHAVEVKCMDLKVVSQGLKQSLEGQCSCPKPMQTNHVGFIAVVVSVEFVNVLISVNDHISESEL